MMILKHSKQKQKNNLLNFIIKKPNLSKSFQIFKPKQNKCLIVKNINYEKDN